MIQKLSIENAEKSVLIIEDTALVAMDFEYVLKSRGYAVLGPVADLKSAFELLGRESPDCALLDINVKGVEIYPVAQELARRDIPFAFVSGYNAEAVLPPEFKGSRSLSKPISDRALVEAVEKMLLGEE